MALLLVYYVLINLLLRTVCSDRWREPSECRVQWMGSLIGCRQRLLQAGAKSIVFFLDKVDASLSRTGQEVFR